MRMVSKYTFVLSFFIVLFACKKDNINNSTISLITPYSNSSDIDSIGMTYGLDSTQTPWGKSSNGITFFPSGNFKQFRTVAQGTVEKVSSYQNYELKWQVDISVRYNSNYSVYYEFHPDSPFQNDAATQLSSISLKNGDILGQGDFLGNLFTVGNNAYLKMTLLINGIAICPENYFTTDAKNSINSILNSDNPDWKICY